MRECFDAAFVAGRAAAGVADPAPIFIVGLPRSGSTLVEQILASHSSVEGTFELPNVLTIVREFDHANAEHDAYPEVVRGVPPGQFAQLGRRYLAETAPLRSGRARFIDKMPNNFSHIGLIHCMLPNATIVDVRRHPMDACFSTYKQHFAEGQSFSYDLEDLGRYYRCYLSLMDHWDEVLPGKVLHLNTNSWCAIPRPTSAGCWRTAAWTSRPLVSRFMKPSARCARRAPSRCGNPCTPPESAIGRISSRSWSRCAAHWATAWSVSKMHATRPSRVDH